MSLPPYIKVSFPHPDSTWAEARQTVAAYFHRTSVVPLPEPFLDAPVLTLVIDIVVLCFASFPAFSARARHHAPPHVGPAYFQAHPGPVQP